MSKPHLIIICGRVHTFSNRQEGRMWRLRILDKVIANTRNHTFGDWSRNKQKLDAMRVKPAHHQEREVGDRDPWYKKFFKPGVVS